MEEKIQIKSLSLYNFQQKIFWVLVSCIGLMVALYMFFVGRTILNVVDRTIAEENIKNLNSSISELESQYIALGQNINLSYAKAQGFQDITRIDYISRAPVLTMRDNAR